MRQKSQLIKILLTLTLLGINSSIFLQKTYSQSQTQPLPLNPTYLAIIHQKISSFSIYPQEAERKGWEGRAKIRFTLVENGRVKEIGLAKSSGSPLLDAAAMSAVKDASPFPSFKHYNMPNLQELEVQVNVVFKKPEERVSPEKIGDLDSLLHLALQNYQPAKIAKEQVELAQLKILKAGRDLLPSLAAEWKNTKGKTISDPYQSKSYGVQAEQTLFDSGRLMYAFRREKLGLEIAKKNYDQIKNELTYKVKKSYYEFAGAQGILANLKDTKGESGQDLGLVSKQYAAGLITKIELLNASSKYERMGYLVDSTEADLSLAKLNLQQALNIDSIEDFQEEVSLDLNVKELKINLKEVQELAQETRADIKSLELGDLSAKYAEMIAARENRPKITMAGSRGKSGEAYTTGRLELSDEWSIMTKVSFLFGGSTVEASRIKDKVLPKSISDTTLKTEANTRQLKFSLLNNLAYYTDRKEAQVSHKQIASQLHESRQKADLEVENAYRAYQKALSLLNTALSDKNFREGEIKVNLMRRNVGELPTSEVMQTRIELAQAKSNYIQAVANYHLAIASLNKAVGISDYYR